MEIHFSLLKAVDPKFLKLTPVDQQLLEDFNVTFGKQVLKH